VFDMVDATTGCSRLFPARRAIRASRPRAALRWRHDRSRLDHAGSALEAGERFHFIDVRSREAWDQGHAAAATHIPRGELAGRLADLDASIPIVVYCWGPACNGGTKAAHLLASLGRAVKEMLGGFEYWAREGVPVEGPSGPIHRAADPLTAPVVGGAAISCDC
jgi:rhodanese-related sulfurtransferase